MGVRPRVDLVLVADYEYPPPTAMGEAYPKNYFRIHLDVPVDSGLVDSLKRALDKQDYKEAWRILTEQAGLSRLPDARDYDVVRSALGQ